jgi:hypothetical protein
MRTGHWIALIGGSIAALLAFACSSSDDTKPISAKAGAGGSIVGQGGQGGSGQGGTGQGGTAQGGSGQGGTAQGGSGQGGGVSGSGGGGPCDTATQFKSTECTTCWQDKALCSAEVTACQGDENCVNFATCFEDCANTDEACQDGCASQHAQGMGKYWKIYGCYDAACHDKCYCGGCDLLKDGPCSDCVEGSCMNECSACAHNGACMGMWMCISYCPKNDTICMGTCQQDPALASGYDPLIAFLGSQSCLGTTCGAQCNN